MGNNTLTRRQLFHKLIVKLTKNAQEKDPLFEKYSRKIFNGRRYSSLSSISKNNPLLERVKPITSGLSQYSGVKLTPQEAIHLLRRTGFGFKKVDVDTLTALTFNDAVDLVLTINTTPPSPPVNNYQNEKTDENGLAYGADWTKNAIDSYDIGGDTNGYRGESLRSWSIGQLLNHDITIREKMTFFWYHFIPIDFETVRQSPNEYTNNNSARICYSYMKQFRDNATGNFKQLIKKVAVHPAMMFQLNNQANKKGAPDENFAREIQELFTIGKDVVNVYSQADIVQAAKVLTGWRVKDLNTPNETTEFYPARHDTSSKSFSSFFGGTTIPDSGKLEIDLFIDMIFTKSKIVSEYICRRLYRYFVYYDIDDNVEANIIVPLAQLFVSNNWDILPVLKKLFKSEHFYDMANKGVYIKSPFDLIIGTMRTFNASHNIADPSNHELQYEVWNQFNWGLSEMEQRMGSIPTVSGWQAYYQKPSFHEYWINSNSLQKRFAYVNYLFYGIEIEKNNIKTKVEVDLIKFVEQFPSNIIEDPDLLVNECVKYLLPVDILLDFKTKIKVRSLLPNDQTPNYYWTGAWLAYKANPSDMIKKEEIKNRLRSLVIGLLQLAEYQLM